MPGNEVGERVHNFFSQESLSQGGQHHSQVLDSKWPVLGNNPWTGSQRQIGSLGSSAQSYNLQQSDSGRGQSSNSPNGSHALTFSQSLLRPEPAKFQSQGLQTNFNGYMHGNRFYQTRPDEANFLAMDRDPDLQNLNSRGLSVYEAQQGNGQEHQTKATDAPIGLDLFGGQQQMSRQQFSMLQSLQRQQSGLNDMQQLQQQVMLMKMQELQRQQQPLQLQQLDARHQNQINQLSPFSKQHSNNQSVSLANGAPNCDTLTYPWAPELGTPNWPQRGSQVLQGSPNGLVFSSNQGQVQRAMGLMPQQFDQSLYGIPVSNSRVGANQYNAMVDKSSVQHMAGFNNSLAGNQYSALHEQVGMQDGALVSRQKSQGENYFVQSSNEPVNNFLNSMQQVNSPQRNMQFQDLRERHEEAVPSNSFLEKTSQDAASVENDVGLDPTEEKILFGSDDNLWAAFGKSPSLTGEASNAFDSGGLLNGYSSLQSGTWSALMQSAVAETSSNDIGLQEEWSGLNFHHNEAAVGSHHPPMHGDAGRRQPGDENMMMAPSADSGSLPPLKNSSANNNYQSFTGFQSLSDKFSYGSGHNVQDKVSQRLVNSAEEGSKQSNFAASGSSQIYGNSSLSVDAEANERNISGPWLSESGRLRQAGDNRADGSNVLGSQAPSGEALQSLQERGNLLPQFQWTDEKQVIQGEVVHGALWKSNSDANPAVDVGKSLTPQVNAGAFYLSNVSSIPSSSTVKGADENSQFFQNGYQTNRWRNVNPSAKAQEVEGFIKSAPQMSKGYQGLESSLNSCDREVKARGSENSDRRENSNDSHRSNVSTHNSAGGMRESVLSDVSDSQSLPSGKQKQNNQSGRKISAPRKFQYHPMGNLDEDVETPHGMKQSPNSQGMSQQSTPIGESKFFSQIQRSSAEFGKGQAVHHQNDIRSSSEVPARASFPGYGSDISAPFNRSNDLGLRSKTPQPSPNMLQLLQKVDQSRELGALTQFSSSECKPSSDVPESENSCGTGRFQRSHSSASQGFNLQLGPPSQRIQNPNHSTSSDSPIHVVSNSHSSLGTRNMGDEGQVKLSSALDSSMALPNQISQCNLENDKSLVHLQTDRDLLLHKAPGNFASAFSSGFPYLRNQYQNQQLAGSSGQVSSQQYVNTSFDKHASHSVERNVPRVLHSSGPSDATFTDADGGLGYRNRGSSRAMSPQASARDPTESVPTAEPLSTEPSSVSQPFFTGIASKPSPGIWTSVPSPHQLLTRSSTVPSNTSHSLQSFVMESTSSASPNQESQGPKRSRNLSSEAGGIVDYSESLTCSEDQAAKESFIQQISPGGLSAVQNGNESQGKESGDKSLAGSAKSAATQREMEAFGRSLKPANFPNQGYSLLSQMRAMKDTDTDPNNRVLKRGSETEIGHTAHIIAAKEGEPKALVPEAASSGDAAMTNISGPANSLEINVPPEQGNPASRDVFMLGRDSSQSNTLGNNTSIKVEHSRISPQMAPSWFNQYGTFKNGQMYPTYDPRKASSIKPIEQPFTLGKSPLGVHTLNSLQQVSVLDSTQSNNIRQGLTPPALAMEHLPPTQLLPHSISGQQSVLSRPKKRKSPSYKPNPWHKELLVTDGSLQTISMAELDWAKAANRLPEKLDEDVEFMEDGLPLGRRKRRLIFTTQLMQQLFHPPAAAILSKDASVHYESVAYTVSRLTLGDACNQVSFSSRDSDVASDGKNLNADDGKSLERNDELQLSNIVEDFMAQARKLEDEFSRLDKRASVLDLIVECQDLEKFSVINRFAKFHGRGQTEGMESSSSSDGGATTQKPFPQRYVTALPMPRNLPNRVQCLSL